MTVFDSKANFSSLMRALFCLLLLAACVAAQVQYEVFSIWNASQCNGNAQLFIFAQSPFQCVSRACTKDPQSGYGVSASCVTGFQPPPGYLVLSTFADPSCAGAPVAGQAFQDQACVQVVDQNDPTKSGSYQASCAKGTLTFCPGTVNATCTGGSCQTQPFPQGCNFGAQFKCQ